MISLVLGLIFNRDLRTQKREQERAALIGDIHAALERGEIDKARFGVRHCLMGDHGPHSNLAADLEKIVAHHDGVRPDTDYADTGYLNSLWRDALKKAGAQADEKGPGNMMTSISHGLGQLVSRHTPGPDMTRSIQSVLVWLHQQSPADADKAAQFVLQNAHPKVEWDTSKVGPNDPIYKYMSPAQTRADLQLQPIRTVAAHYLIK